ncbi:MAG: hypothetical protein IJ910_02640 [Bacteroidaceae bacterium]|nr:hypothetical protein [Bacteroidaceae bacterium]
MSDGNFNRQLLLKTDLSTGLRAGKAQMRAKAEQAFKEVLAEHFPQTTAEERDAILKDFMERLRK